MTKLDCSINSLSLLSYTPEQIKKLAVKEITSLVSIEPTLGKGAANGLYDASLGSLSDREPCRTCKLSYYECNGHYGRIEFCKPIYRPDTFDILMKLIKGICFYCHTIDPRDGIKECLTGLKKDDTLTSVRKFSDFDDIISLTPVEQQKLALKMMSTLKRRICIYCGKKPLVFTKSRKGEILVHISRKTQQGKDDSDGYGKRKMTDEEPCAKKRKLNYSDEELYGKFTDDDCAIFPEILREHLRLLWVKEHENLILLFPIFKYCDFEYPTDIFFMENMLINPPMNRVPAIMHGDQMTESPETTNMSIVMRAAHTLREVVRKTDNITPDQHYQNVREGILDLQNYTNGCFDSNKNRVIGSQPGLRQKIDKKEGLFRKNIMGKRVNFACRSVISPDPTIGLDEIGVPEVFLMKLTFPQPMNALNKDFLIQCIMNGPDVYPGAVSYQIDGDKPIAIFKNRESIVEKLELKMQEKRNVIVYRHAIEGEVLIMNRQPTLHKLSMQAHVIKPILGQKAKTFRMHYSNCKAYNADFDGDEMNGHYLQSIEAQVEAKLLVNVAHQHSTVKDGSPVAGLIQDHIVSGTKICFRDCFLTRVEYLDLVNAGINGNYTPPMKLLPPAIMKPHRLWTGKQMLSTILMNTVPNGIPLPNITCAEPKKNSLWGISKEELELKLSDMELVIVDGYVCTGTFDKTHLGPSTKGLCTDLRELYGDKVQLHILTCLSRALNHYLTYTGFSVGIKDGFLNEDGESIRNTTMGKIRSVGLTSIAHTFGMKPNDINLAKMTECMERAQFDKSDEYRNKMAEIDTNFKLLSLNYINNLNLACKKNLKDKFPFNNLSFMSNIGAKGGESNITKIAIALGAIEIEGKRCPLTVGGRTLPSFRRYDFDPASRGFAIGRFTTGLKPQELFFESMAGRDGLVDTAVKTSSSGYLQRCLIKHMEDLAIREDATVRDNNDNIIQFRYGYDGLDVVKSVGLDRSDYQSFIKQNKSLYTDKYMRDYCGSDDQLAQKVIKMKSDMARIDNGEPVGLLAAQSIGEPSTQMTLNTFHNAGQSEMNVTLGIPRLREILMSGSEKINTPTMEVPILTGRNAEKNAQLILKKFNKLRLKDVIDLPVKIKRSDDYEIKLSFKDKKMYANITSLSKEEIIPLIEKTFFKKLAKILKIFKTQMSNIKITDNKDDEDDIQLNDKDEDDKEPADDEPKASEEDKGAEDISDVSDIDSDSDTEGENEEQDESSHEEEDGKKDDKKPSESMEQTFATDQKLSKVVEMCPAFFKSYRIDKSNDPKWIKLTINLKEHRIDLKSLLLNLIENTIISSVDGIDKALIIKKSNSFVTEGFNHMELLKFDQVFDLNKFYSNNIVKMSKLYGIEAAVSCIEHEVKNVFKSYSIDVSSRHLRMIADYLTNNGAVAAFNRHSMKNHPSPIQRASYETALSVLNEMFIHGNIDKIKSPSSNIMFGQLVSHIGTNSVQLLHDNKAI